MSYIDWGYYSSLHSKVSDEKEFECLRTKAEVKINTVTHMRAAQFMKDFRKTNSTDFQKQIYSQLQNTVCELVNALYVQENSDMGSGIVSVSNDGYSESYKITTAVEKDAQLLAIIRSGLSGTGLAGVL